MVVELQFVLNTVAGALAKWAGEQTGAKASKLLDAIRFARIQLEVAHGMLAKLPELANDQERAQTIKTADELVRTSRANVRRAALDVAIAVPVAVGEAFEQWETASVNALDRLGESARGQVMATGLVAAGMIVGLGVVAWFTRKVLG